MYSTIEIYAPLREPFSIYLVAVAAAECNCKRDVLVHVKQQIKNQRVKYQHRKKNILQDARENIWIEFVNDDQAREISTAETRREKDEKFAMCLEQLLTGHVDR